MTMIKGLQARARYGRERLNIPSTTAPKRITTTFILDVMGVTDRKERASIYAQLETLGEKASQQ
jgi:hypothetical protein